MNEVRVLQDIVPLERDPEEEPQRRDALVEGRHADAARGQMQLIAAHVLEARRVGRSAKERREVLDPLHVVMLGLRRELADRHVFDHAPAQRAHRLVGHGDAPVLSEGCEPLIFKTGRPVRLSCRAALAAAAPYRASGLVLWPAAEAAAPCGDFRLRTKCGLDLLTESLSHFDPQPTLTVGAAAHVRRSDRMARRCGHQVPHVRLPGCRVAPQHVRPFETLHDAGRLEQGIAGPDRNRACPVAIFA